MTTDSWKMLVSNYDNRVGSEKTAPVLAISPLNPRCPTTPATPRLCGCFQQVFVDLRFKGGSGTRTSEKPRESRSRLLMSHEKFKPRVGTYPDPIVY